MLTIGFAEKYYTLWDVISVTNQYQAPNGYTYPSYEVRHYSYIKNISKDMNKVIKKYPDTPIDDSLRGRKKSFSMELKQDDLSPEILKFGKYAGADVRELIKVDIGYCLWLVKEDSFYSRSIIDVIKETPIYKMYIIELERERQQKIDSINEYKSGDYVFHLQANVNDEGHAYISGYGHVLKLVFPEVMEMSYNNIQYYIPVLNGKGKRVKNKDLLYSIEVTASRWGEKTGELYQEANVLKVKSIKTKNV